MAAGADEPTPDRREVDDVARARARVVERIAAACLRSGREPSSVTLVAVSKTVPTARLRAAVAVGVTELGENRVQEAAEKIPLVPGARWHLVGPLQANKARRAVELFDVVQSLDTVALAARLDRLVREIRGLPAGGPIAADDRLPVLLQVNVDRDPAKAGFKPETLPAALAAIERLTALRTDGLMTIGRLVDEPEAARSTFAALRRQSEVLRREHPALGPNLSMGMTDDFEVAVEEGATHLRVGRALFGERPHA